MVVVNSDHGELQGRRDVLPYAGNSLCWHPYACIDAHRQQGSSSRLVPGWHVHGYMVTSDPVRDGSDLSLRHWYACSRR